MEDQTGENRVQWAGLVNVELVSIADVFAGAEGQTDAHAFETRGANIRATS